MPRQRPWSDNELLLAFRLYCHTLFGRLHARNPDIIALAERIGRTPGAVAMKACNFASLDPVQQARGIKALGNVSRGDEALWQRFTEDPEAVASQAEASYAKLFEDQVKQELAEDNVQEFLLPDGPTEYERMVRMRRVQRFFREMVLVSYENKCALSGLAVPQLLVASHIIPWKDDERRRADPHNGLCLNALYDRAFDCGLIGLDDSLRVMVSPLLRSNAPPPLHRDALLALEGRELHRPVRFAPDAQAVQWHREHVFRACA